MMESSSIEGVHTSMNTSRSPKSSSVLKKSTTANLSTHGTDINASHTSLGSASQRVRIKRKHLKERMSPFEGGQRSPREDTENIPPALPATLPKDYEEIAQRLAGSIHSRVKDVPHRTGSTSVEVPDIHTTDTSRLDPGKHSLDPKLSGKSSVPSEREPGQIPFKLKQGQATHRDVYSHSIDSHSDVRVTQFAAGQKRKVMKESLSKRSEQMGPVRRVFEPHYVGTSSSDKTKVVTHERDEISQMAASTAAAVAATAPLIKYQYDLENKVSLILEKLQHLESASVRSKYRGQDPEVAAEQLQRRLDELTQVKLKELEKLQFQHQHIEGHFKHPHPSSSPERPDDKGKEVRNKEHVSSGIRKEKLTPDANPLRTAPERGMTVASRSPQGGGLPMGYPEPLSDSSQPARMIGQPLQGTKHVRYAPAVHLHKRPQDDMYEHSANVDPWKGEIPDSKEGILGTKSSPLDTPAPRKYAPVPHSKSTRTRLNGGLLEEILSSQGEAIRQKSPDRSYVEESSPPSQNPTLEGRGVYHSQVEKQADSLLTEIASLRKDISKKIKGRQSPQATSSKSPKRFSLEPSSLAMFQNQPQIVTPETRKDAERELQKWQEKRLAPPPLDEYMRKPYHPPTVTTPPSRPIHTSNLVDTHVLTSGAPVQPSSAIIQAETLLKRVQTSRKYLESNLEVIQRSKREQEFQEVMESMYADGDAAERTQIKLLVDDYITLVDSQVKEELRHYRSNLAFSPPTKLPPDKHQKPLAAETSKTSKPAKKKVSAKIDTGLRKPKETGDGKPIKDIIATGNETREKPKEKKSVTKKVSSVSTKFPVKDYQDNRYLSSIYGRNLLQQSQRTTLRDAPYLRIANKSPQTKRQRMSPKKDANKNTTQTQTPGGTTEKKVSLLQQFPSHTLPSGSKQSQSYTFQNYRDSPEILRETAIPLGEPRVGGERTEPMVIFNKLDIPPSNKLKQNNVAVISMVTQKPQLEIKHLPPVDIDTELSSISEDQGVPVHRPPQIEEIKTQDLLADQYQEQKEQDADSDKDDIPESSDVLSFQGYRHYPGEYHGPPFPPQTPHQHLERRSEDIAADLERKGLLEHRAMEWIEQELMAKMISEFHSRLSRPEERTDSPESDKHHPVDAIGSGGLQLFVDVGQPVNPGLVSSLVKEVLEEDIAKMLGQHLRNLSGEDTNVPATDQRPHSVAEEVSHHELVHTPEVTPSHSPFRSPSPVLHEGQIKTPEPTASDISQEAEPESETTPEETDNLIQAPTSPVGTPPMTPPLSKGALTPEPGHVETPPPSFHEDRPLLLEDTGTVGTPSLTVEESPPVSPDEVKETPQQSPIPPLSLEPEVTPSPTLPPSPQREVTPPPSTQSSSSSTTEDITATETSGREISAGEWLISQQSVGEVPKVLMQGTFLDGTSLQDGGEASQTTSSDSLVETEELENEVAQDQEEGEIRGDVQLDDIRDPMVAILSKLNQLPGAYHLPAQVAQGITQGDPSSSPGEISEGQRPVVAPGVEAHLKRIGAGDDRNLPQSPGEVNLPKEGDIYNREPGETPRIIAQGKTELTHKDSTLRLSQLNSKSSSSDNSEKRSAKDGKRGTLSSDEGRGGEREPVLGLQIAAPRIIQVGSHQSPREEESPKQTEPAGGRQPNLDLFGTHTMSDRDVRPRTLTPDAINMEALLQSGYLSQTFSQSDGGPPMGSLLGQRGTLGGNESGGTLRQTGGALGTTFGTTMTEDSLEVAAAKRVPEEPQQKKVSITLPSTSNIEEEKLDWSQTESEVGNQTVSDVSEISAGDL